MPTKRDRAPTYYENILVPKHDILSESETKRVLEEMKTNGDKLPRIFKDDPALQGKGRKGQVVRITREDVSGKKYQYYRIVID